MARGRPSLPTPLPEAFESWKDFYLKWEEFRTSNTRSARPSRAERFSQKYNVAVWLIGTITYIFRSAERDDEVGEYAREIVAKVESGEMGAPKANNLIRAFVSQNPRLRTYKGQVEALNTLLARLHDDAMLARNIHNINPAMTKAELDAYIANISKQTRALAQLKTRLVEASQAREKEES